jgi:hypothetical protein
MCEQAVQRHKGTVWLDRQVPVFLENPHRVRSGMYSKSRGKSKGGQDSDVGTQHGPRKDPISQTCPYTVAQCLIWSPGCCTPRSISPLGFIYNPEKGDSHFLRNGGKRRDVISQTQRRSQTPPRELRHEINVITLTILVYPAPTFEEAL